MEKVVELEEIWKILVGLISQFMEKLFLSLERQVKLRSAVDAISSISNGSLHGAVYSKLEAVNRKEKQEKMKLWEDQNVFD